MKNLAVAGCMIVLVAVAASVPLSKDGAKHRRSKDSQLLRNQLFDMASLSKRSSSITIPQEQEPWIAEAGTAAADEK